MSPGLALLAATVPVLPEVALAACAATVVAAIAVADRITYRAKPAEQEALRGTTPPPPPPPRRCR